MRICNQWLQTWVVNHCHFFFFSYLSLWCWGLNPQWGLAQAKANPLQQSCIPSPEPLSQCLRAAKMKRETRVTVSLPTKLMLRKTLSCGRFSAGMQSHQVHSSLTGKTSICRFSEALEKLTCGSGWRKILQVWASDNMDKCVFCGTCWHCVPG